MTPEIIDEVQFTRSENFHLGDLGCYIENISGRLNELKSNLEYIDDDLNDINSRMDDIQSEIGNLKE
jgi:archaellum component FlaC